VRQLITPHRRLREIAAVPDGMHRGKLAEDYDGIGQHVMVSLSAASAGSAFKSRIASGDYGGGRTFPAGTLVRVFSYRGQLETFLGNLGGCEENFNRQENATLITGLPPFGPSGLWTVDASFTSDWGSNWFAARYSNVSRQNSIYIDGDSLVMDVKFVSTPEAERLLWSQSEEPLNYPIEILYSFIHLQAPWPPPSGSLEDPDFTVAMSSLGDAPIHNFANYTNLLYSRTAPTTPELITIRGGTGSGTEFDSNSDVVIPLELNKQILWKVRYTDPDSSEDGGLWGVKAKAWNEDQSEPDWQSWDLVKGGTATQVTPQELIFYSDDVGNGVAGRPAYALTKWDYIKILEGGCIVGGPSDLPAVMPLP